MPGVPAPQFAPTSRGQVAYQTVGDGDTTLVVLPPLAQNIEKMWEQPAFWRPIRRLGRAVRFVHYDKLGTGLSDPLTTPATIDDRVEELLAVLDGVGAAHAWLLGLSEGGMIAIAAAAATPSRVDGLILVNTTSGAGARPDPDRHGSGRDATEVLRYFTDVADRWTTPSSLVLADFAPSLRCVPGIDGWMPAYERAAASPAMIHSLVLSALQLDVTPHLAGLTVPTLVVHHRGDRVISVSNGRFLADSIPGARLVEIDGDDHFAWVSPGVDVVIDEILHFVGAPPAAGRHGALHAPWDTLTPTERRIARLAQRGLTNAEIATAARSSVRTVETQLSRIYAKLAVRTRTELAIRGED